MPFVVRDTYGNIVGVVNQATREAVEEVAAEDPELVDFLLDLGGELNLKRRILESDAEMGRVVEDLVDIMMTKRLINITDFPNAAQSKLNLRRHLRERMNTLQGLVNADDIL
ncbi:MAG: hypothetical protein QF926_03290 [Alphaproteobacteria bacterium]|jgi:hypothetical protein|nr:hypothetical protein [Alphaproteobacteria bacterium]MDP6515637.1 hypothetical protein [Alphaproteobacteria bacterium]|tara:strand:- start:101 stop:436 length:336 start_codon:yes stop_codon:yes gene_type:complete